MRYHTVSTPPRSEAIRGSGGYPITLHCPVRCAEIKPCLRGPHTVKRRGWGQCHMDRSVLDCHLGLAVTIGVRIGIGFGIPIVVGVVSGRATLPNAWRWRILDTA